MTLRGHAIAAATLSCGLSGLLACSDSQDAPVTVEETVIEEVDVTAPGSNVAETEAVSSILTSIAAARQDIARGAPSDADSALRAPVDLLENFVTRQSGVPSELGQRDAEHGALRIPLATTLTLVREARGHLQSGDLAAADRALAQAQGQIELRPNVASGP